jgi:glycosyltransferase involved in cell wall biosynthesis
MDDGARTGRGRGDRGEGRVSTPEVTVIIATHSRPTLLPAAVESAKAAGTNVEIVVVDDASCDDTAAVCAGLAGINYLRLEQNLGVAGARNAGLLRSRGRYIAFLDDDDRRLPGTLDRQAALLDANPAAGITCGRIVYANQTGVPTGEVVGPRHPSGDVFWHILRLDFPLMPIAALIRRECFLRVGLFHERLNGIDDFDLFARMAEHYPFAVTDDAIGIYRLPAPDSGQGSSSQAAHLMRAYAHQRELLRLPRAAAAPAAVRNEARRVARDRVADTLLYAASRRWASGPRSFVWRNVAAALRLSPLRAARPHAVWHALTAGPR